VPVGERCDDGPVIAAFRAGGHDVVSGLARRCIVCGGADPVAVFQTAPLPVDANRLYDRADEALGALRAPIRLAGCQRCGHLFNAAYDDALVDYAGDYENSQVFSPRFRGYLAGLAAELVARYGLRGKPFVDIGGGYGDLATMLLEAGAGSGVVVDPGARAGTAAERHPGLSFIRDVYGRAATTLPAALLTSRHVLEHLADPAALAGLLREAVDRVGAGVYVEVPNGDYVIDATAIWELTYTHVSYFTARSLDELFRRAGFGARELSTRFDGQFLAVLTGRAGAAPPPPPSLTIFERAASRKVLAWRARLAGLRASNARVAMWGAGAKTVTFLSMCDREGGVATIVDANPRKHGKYLPPAGLRIEPPEALASLQPDVVLTMNPAYREEIAAALREIAPRAHLMIAG